MYRVKIYRPYGAIEKYVSMNQLCLLLTFWEDDAQVFFEHVNTLPLSYMTRNLKKRE